MLSYRLGYRIRNHLRHDVLFPTSGKHLPMCVGNHEAVGCHLGKAPSPKASFWDACHTGLSESALSSIAFPKSSVLCNSLLGPSALVLVSSLHPDGQLYSMPNFALFANPIKANTSSEWPLVCSMGVSLWLIEHSIPFHCPSPNHKPHCIPGL